MEKNGRPITATIYEASGYFFGLVWMDDNELSNNGKLFKQNEVSFQETPFLVVRAFWSFEIVERFDSVFDCRNVQL